jgi:hypothetical protein
MVASQAKRYATLKKTSTPSPPPSICTNSLHKTTVSNLERVENRVECVALVRAFVQWEPIVLRSGSAIHTRGRPVAGHKPGLGNPGRGGCSRIFPEVYYPLYSLTPLPGLPRIPSERGES